MEYQLRKAQWEDLPRIQEIYAYARRFMAETGNPNQWGTTTPQTSQLEKDIQTGDLYVLIHENQIHGVFYFFIGPDRTRPMDSLKTVNGVLIHPMAPFIVLPVTVPAVFLQRL